MIWGLFVVMVYAVVAQEAWSSSGETVRGVWGEGRE